MTRRYLVAADGAHSAVRAALGIPMRGPGTCSTPSRCCSVRRSGTLLGAHRYGIYAIGAPGRRERLPAGGTGRPLVLRYVAAPGASDPARAHERADRS